ncbi:MAG: MCE family protein [Deltaproteobacteria bacterium]|nr:MCE family protein [Deltaproteobacteria bacterium]
MEPGSWKAEVALGALVVAALAGFLWLTFAVGGAAPSNAQRYVLLLDSALGLTEDNAVAVAGVKVGIVDEIRVEGRRARVGIAIAPDVQLHADARAALRQRTLLGEKYVDLDPGAAPAPVLTPGAVLENNVPTVEIDQVIRDVAVLVDRLNRITPPLESALAHVDHMLEGEGGARLEDQVVATLNDVRVLVRGTSKLVEGSGDDVAAVIAMAREHGPGLANRLESASARLDDILAGVDPKMIEEAAARVGPAAENIDHITGDMRTAMADLRTAAKRLDGVLSRFDRTLSKIESVDEKSVREFFQVQGVRVNLIPDQTVTSRIKKLRDESVALPE